MKIIHREKWKIANLGHFMEATTSSCQIFVEYVKTIDFSGFIVLPDIKKGSKFIKTGQFSLYCVSKQVNFNKMSKLKVLEKVGFSQMSTP